MVHHDLLQRFAQLSTPLIADACIRERHPIRIAPSGIRPLIPMTRLAGWVRAARHYGSVDVFLEVIGRARPGDVLVIDNGGRPDEGCIGDLTALEARAAGLSGIVLWGYHRDTTELVQIDVPLFSYGACPAGPQRLDQREPEALDSACFGEVTVTGEDVVFADDDGVLFVSQHHVERVLSTAWEIGQTERRQAALLRTGRTLREQLRFDEYLRKRSAIPSYAFREHLRALGGALEE